MNTRLGLLFGGFLALAATTPAWALDLFDTGVTALTVGDPTQVGRLSRNAVPQDWTGGEPYPGVINLTTSYTYQTYDVAITDTPYVQIEVDSTSVNNFVSAYLNSYDPTNKMTNYLGDAGSSGNSFGVDPLFFQVIVPNGDTLVLVVNNTGAGSVGVGDGFDILVEGFTDTQFDEPGSGGVPEPAIWAMLLAGFGGVGVMSRRARRNAAPVAA